jgi:hypothetical protein
MVPINVDIPKSEGAAEKPTGNVLLLDFLQGIKEERRLIHNILIC